jgi:hypothetical protein
VNILGVSAFRYIVFRLILFAGIVMGTFLQTLVEIGDLLANRPAK